MQAKGLVKFFGIALFLVCLYQLSFTWLASSVDKKADRFAADQVSAIANLSDEAKADKLRKAKRSYLDSVSTESVFMGYTYDDIKSRQLNLGLDLQGGMSAVLQVTLDDLIRSLANNSEDALIKKAIRATKELQKNNEADFVTLFGQAFSQVGNGAKMATLFANANNQDVIDYNSSNEQVLAYIRTQADDAVNQTFKILRTRIDKFGVTQPNINLLENSGRIQVELAGVDDPERVRQLLQATAKLEFWEVYNADAEMSKMVFAANEAVKKEQGIEDLKKEDAKKDVGDAATDTPEGDTAAANDTTAAKEGSLVDKASGDSGAASDSLSQDELVRQNPFIAALNFSGSGGATIGYANGKDTARLNSYLKMPAVRAEFPPNLKFLYGAKAIEGTDGNNNLFPVYAIKSRQGSVFKAPMEGDVIIDARGDYNYDQQIIVNMDMNSEGATKWRKLTGENIGKSVAIVLDDQVYSAPVVQSEIAGGTSQITGQFDITEAQDLANILKAGKLPAPARIVEEALVGPSLGAKSIRAGLISLLAGILLVLGFMIFYYSKGGWVANLALILNLFFVVGVLASIGATLTLPGMAGIVLTIGMAVDANVIIFERIREELARGSGMKKAIADGYSKSYSAIIDANLTTLITAIILSYFGLGPVLGFATVLMIGIFSSLFTAILVTRLFIDWRLGKGDKFSFYTNATKGMFKGTDIDFIGKRKKFYMIGGAVIAIGLLSMMFKGFELGVDFKGGRTYVVDFDKSVSASDITSALADKGVFGMKPLVRTYGSNDQVKITTQYMIDSEEKEADNIVMKTLYAGLAKANMLGTTTEDQFISGNAEVPNKIMSSQKVGPTIADDITRGAIWATIFALMGIFLYILIRFRKWQYGLAAVLTIIHDTLILLTIFSLFSGFLPFSLEIDQVFIAALLTVIGYSINDTVVVFDRIREYLTLNPKRKQEDVINEAINSTLSRTVVTSLTTLLVVLILFIFGGEVIRGFSFALLIGIIVGTYSSIFVATPIVVDLTKADAEYREKAVERNLQKSKKSKKSKKPKSVKS